MLKVSEYITPNQAARMKGVHHRTVMRAIKRGDLQAQLLSGPAIDTTTRYLLRRSEVENWTPRPYGKYRAEGKK